MMYFEYLGHLNESCSCLYFLEMIPIVILYCAKICVCWNSSYRFLIDGKLFSYHYFLLIIMAFFKFSAIFLTNFNYPAQKNPAYLKLVIHLPFSSTPGAAYSSAL